MIEVAYVMYEDKVKQIVNLYDIKDFKPKHLNDFNKQKMYTVYWSPPTSSSSTSNVDCEDTQPNGAGFYMANILKLGSSRKSLEEDLNSKRVGLPHKPLYENGDVNERGKTKERASTAKANKEAITKNRNDVMKGIMKDKMKERKLEGPCVVPVSLKNTMQEQCASMKQNELDLLAKLESSENKVIMLTQSQRELETLNKRLQKQLLTYIEGHSVKPKLAVCPPSASSSSTSKIDLSSTSFLREDAPFNFDDTGVARMDDTVQSVQVPVLASGLQKDREEVGLSSVPEENDLMIKLGGGIIMKKQKWEDINNESNNDSQFVKKMAVAVWGDDALSKRTVGGNPANARKNADGERHPGLTPAKINIIKNKFRERLVKRYPNNTEIVEEKLKCVTKFINEKCNTLRKTVKTVVAHKEPDKDSTDV